MKRIYVNLKRFDVPSSLGGVNHFAAPQEWARLLISGIEAALKPYPTQMCTIFLPEAHLLAAQKAHSDKSIRIGCQGVYRQDVSPKGNFGAFTTHRPAAAMRALGVQSVLIGHCEERMDLLGIMAAGGAHDETAVDRLLNEEIRAAQAQGLDVLFCIGERAEEKTDRWEVLQRQIDLGLAQLDRTRVTLAYEPVWAIGPGKEAPQKQEIAEVARFIKQITAGLPLVYGGGLKADNARALASISEIDGGLIALTRFTGEIGFYPDEFSQIVTTYLKG